MKGGEQVKRLLYVIYITVNLSALILYKMEYLEISLLQIIYIVEAMALFLICCNSFYVPRNMDTIQMLEFKNEMKTDPILLKPLLFLTCPIIICFILLHWI